MPLLNKISFLKPVRIHLCLLLSLALFCQACGKKIFSSNCDIAIKFKPVKFNQLVDSVQFYNHQYVEVSGLYKSGAEESALFSDDFFKDYSDKNALWVNFSQDCPLYLAGTNQGLFSSNDGKFMWMHQRKIVIRGLIDTDNKGHLGQYKGTIDHVSLVEW